MLCKYFIFFIKINHFYSKNKNIDDLYFDLVLL